MTNVPNTGLIGREFHSESAANSRLYVPNVDWVVAVLALAVALAVTVGSALVEVCANAFITAMLSTEPVTIFSRQRDAAEDLLGDM